MFDTGIFYIYAIILLQEQGSQKKSIFPIRDSVNLILPVLSWTLARR